MEGGLGRVGPDRRNPSHWQQWVWRDRVDTESLGRDYDEPHPVQAWTYDPQGCTVGEDLGHAQTEEKR